MDHSHAAYYVYFVDMADRGETEEDIKNNFFINSGCSFGDVNKTVLTHVRETLPSTFGKIYLHRAFLFAQICRRKCAFNARATWFAVLIHLV